MPSAGRLPKLPPDMVYETEPGAPDPIALKLADWFWFWGSDTVMVPDAVGVVVPAGPLVHDALGYFDCR